jgi:hypothetical protein
MLEMEPHSISTEVEGVGPGGIVVVVSVHDADGAPQLFELNQDGGIANIAEVPNLIGRLQQLQQVFRVPVMSIRDNGNSQGHGSGQWCEKARSKTRISAATYERDF